MGALKLSDDTNNPTVINVWYTIADVTGAGFINLIGLYNATGRLDTMHLKVEIDGDVPEDIDMIWLWYIIGIDTAGVNRKQGKIPLYLRFEESFKVTYMDDLGSTTTHAGVLYTIDA